MTEARGSITEHVPAIMSFAAYIIALEKRLSMDAEIARDPQPADECMEARVGVPQSR